MVEDEKFFVGQKLFLRKGDCILVLFSERDGKVDLPGGKIQKGESFDDALKREIREEIGVLKIKVGRPVVIWSTTKRYGKDIGKRIFLVGLESEYISGEIKLSGEHSGYRWVNRESYRELEGMGDHFEALERYFATI